MSRVIVAAERQISAPAEQLYPCVAHLREHHPRILPPASTDFRVERGGVGAGTVSGVATHPEDDVVLAAALSGGAQFVVTSDHGLLRLGRYRELVIVSAAQCVPFISSLACFARPALTSPRPIRSTA